MLFNEASLEHPYDVILIRCPQISIASTMLRFLPGVSLVLGRKLDLRRLGRPVPVNFVGY